MSKSLKCLCLASLLITACAGLGLESPRKPNFILVYIDDMGYGDLGCFGSEVNRTPHLDALAAEGMRLTDFYVASSVCTPSRAALMTGNYPQRVGLHLDERELCVLFPGGKKGIHPDELTLAESLKEAGYATACVGKWHLGDQLEFLPTRHGFDEYYGIPYSNDMVARTGPGRPPLPLMRDEVVIEAPAVQDTLTKRFTEESLRFIREHADEPFFLYIPHAMVHVPLHASDEFRDQSQNGRYGDAVEELDASMGAIVAALREEGIAEDTVIVFTSDNGARGDNGGSNGSLRGRKGQTWDGGQRVPCIAWWPREIPAGSICDELTVAFDLFPTFAKLAGARAPEMDGRDISALLRGEAGATSPHEAFYFYQMNQLQAVRSGRWKLHLSLADKRRNWGKSEGPAPLQLFDLGVEVSEETDVSEAHPEVVARLTALAEEARATLGDIDRAGSEQREAGWVDEPDVRRMPE
ncbi:MAG: sulfatase [Planctomycetes bacterium]|nr:sulfatase [Planctomycetota bacterium]